MNRSIKISLVYVALLAVVICLHERINFEHMYDLRLSAYTIAVISSLMIYPLDKWLTGVKNRTLFLSSPMILGTCFLAACFLTILGSVKLIDLLFSDAYMLRNTIVHSKDLIGAVFYTYISVQMVRIIPLPKSVKGNNHRSRIENASR